MKARATSVILVGIIDVWLTKIVELMQPLVGGDHAALLASVGCGYIYDIPDYTDSFFLSPSLVA